MTPPCEVGKTCPAKSLGKGVSDGVTFVHTERAGDVPEGREGLEERASEGGEGATRRRIAPREKRVTVRATE